MNNINYCPICGSALTAEHRCANGHSTEIPKERPFADYAVRKCKSDVEGKLFDLIRDFLKAHLFGTLLTVSVVFTLVASIASSHGYIRKTSASPQEYLAAIAEDGQLPPDVESATEEDYYTFIKETLIPEYGVTAAEPKNFTSVDNSWNWIPVARTLTENGYAGLFGADIYDYNGDGKLDMVAAVLTKGDIRDWLQGQAEGWKASKAEAFDLSILFYSTDDDGNIKLISTLPALAQIDGSSFGQMSWNTRDWNGTRYLYGKVSLEDMTTYGPTIGDIWHIDSSGQFVHDKIVGNLSWGQGSYKGDLNAQLRTLNTEFPADIADAIMAELSISWPNNKVSTFTAVDHTGLAEKAGGAGK